MDEVHALAEAATNDLEMPAVLERLRAALPYMSELPTVGHPNGFVAMTLMENEGYDVRLHLWTGAEKAQEEHAIHNHVYDLRSLVLIGGLRQIRWNVEADPQGSMEEFTVTYASAGSFLTSTGNTVSADVVEARNIVAGERYSVSAGEFHSITPSRLPTATLFAKIPAEHPDLGRVVGEALPSGQLQSDRSRLSTEEVEQHLRQLTKLIS